MKHEFPVMRQFARQMGIDPSNVKLFDIQNVADMFWASPKENLDWDKDFGPLLSPFPVLWMESQQSPPDVGGHVFNVGVTITSMRPTDPIVAKLVRRQRVEPPSIDDVPGKPFQILAIRAVTHVDGDLTEIPLVLIMAVDATGKKLWRRFAEAGEESGDEMGQLLEICVNPALMAIGLINCKNVDTEPHVTKPRGGKKSRRQPTPLTYHTIKLPRPTRGGGGGGGGQGEPMALHMVRGHFRTYTKEKPLLGKLVGTFWVPYHVRGDAKAGVSKAVYEVDIPEGMEQGGND